MKKLVDMIIDNATRPIDPGIEWELNPKCYPGRELYICHGTPKAIVGEVCVLNGWFGSMVTMTYIPEKIYEFDFWNELDGFIEHNRLNPTDINYDNVPTSAYIVDIDGMILYRYHEYEVASVRTR